MLKCIYFRGRKHIIKESYQKSFDFKTKHPQHTPQNKSDPSSEGHAVGSPRYAASIRSGLVCAWVFIQPWALVTRTVG